MNSTDYTSGEGSQEVKERGMIFNAEMVRAILEGRKTQTRRVMAIQPEHSGLGLRRVIDSKNGKDNDKYFWAQSDACGLKARSKPFACPHGSIGDRIWVRETWSDVNLEGAPAVAYRADDEVYDLMEDESLLVEDGAFNYQDPRVSKYQFAAWHSDLISGVEGNWRPSIHMPRWASRILLEITGVRVERLNDISDEDAKAEGVPKSHKFPDTYLTPKGDFADADIAFQRLWESIYGEENWQSNPWVWVIEFKRIEVTGHEAN